MLCDVVESRRNADIGIICDIYLAEAMGQTGAIGERVGEVNGSLSNVEVAVDRYDG